MPTTITFIKTIATPRLTTGVHRLRPLALSREVTLSHAKRFGLSAGPSGALTQEERGFTYAEGPFTVLHWAKSGAIRYYDRTRWQIDDGRSNVDLTDARAQTLAQAFLKDTGLVPMEEAEVLKVTRLRVASMQRGAMTADERVIDVGVVFRRKLGNLPVEGPGGKAVVYLDAAGKVTGCDCLWRPIQQEERKLLPAQLQSPRFVRTHITKAWRQAAFSRVEVLNQRFCYFELGPDDAQQFLQPVYLSEMKLTSGDGRMTMRTFHLTTADKTPLEELVPAVKEIPAQPPRRG